MYIHVYLYIYTHNYIYIIYIYNYICYMYIAKVVSAILLETTMHSHHWCFPHNNLRSKCRTHHLEYLPYLLCSCLGPKFHKFHRWSNLVQSDLSQLFIHTHTMYEIYIYANIWDILMGSMLPYIAAPLGSVMGYLSHI